MSSHSQFRNFCAKPQDLIFGLTHAFWGGTAEVTSRKHAAGAICHHVYRTPARPGAKDRQGPPFSSFPSCVNFQDLEISESERYPQSAFSAARFLCPGCSLEDVCRMYGGTYGWLDTGCISRSVSRVNLVECLMENWSNARRMQVCKKQDCTARFVNPWSSSARVDCKLGAFWIIRD